MQRGPIPATDFLFYLYGQNFGPGSQVFVDGQPSTTTVLSPATVKAEYIFSAASVIGTHQLSVKVGSQISNAIPFTTYWPQQGPFVMQAIPSYFVGEDDDPTFFAVADINGDGRADVIMPGDPGKTVIMYGQADGSLAVNQTVAGFFPLALAVGDVDGNGTVDLVGISSRQIDGTVARPSMPVHPLGSLGYSISLVQLSGSGRADDCSGRVLGKRVLLVNWSPQCGFCDLIAPDLSRLFSARHMRSPVSSKDKANAMRSENGDSARAS
jgi:hypothetical protein